jgi:hypothetical protein
MGFDDEIERQKEALESCKTSYNNGLIEAAS